MDSRISGSNGHVKGTTVLDAPDQPITADEMAEFTRNVEAIVGNAMIFRRDFMNRFFDPRRNYYEECGYPKTGAITAENLKELYDREAVAARVVELYPKEMWQVQPEVYETDEDEATPFEQAWDDLVKSLRGEESWFKGTDGNPIWEYLTRADILSGIGSYGIILFGFDDVNDVQGLSEPVKRKKWKPGAEGEPGAGRVLTGLRVFPETLAQVTAVESNPLNPRYGLPTQYLVTFNDPIDEGASIAGPASSTAQVHWSRVLHVADTHHTASAGEVYAVPRLRPVLNDVLGAMKVSCSSPEAFFKGCLNLLSLETHPQLGGDVNVKLSSLRDMVEQVQNGYQKWWVLMGMSAKSIAPTVTDPTPHWDKRIESICLKMACPVPVFKGYEIGEQASTNNADDWKSRVRERKTSYGIPRLVIPFVDRLISVGCLPEPDHVDEEDDESGKTGYLIHWPDPESRDQAKKAATALQVTQALVAYVGGNVQSLVPPQAYLTTVLEFEDREVEAWLAEAEQLELERKEQEMLDQEEAIERGLAPDPAMAEFGAVEESGRAKETHEQGMEKSKVELDRLKRTPITPPKGGAK